MTRSQRLSLVVGLVVMGLYLASEATNWEYYASRYSTGSIASFAAAAFIGFGRAKRPPDVN